MLTCKSPVWSSRCSYTYLSTGSNTWTLRGGRSAERIRCHPWCHHLGELERENMMKILLFLHTIQIQNYRPRPAVVLLEESSFFFILLSGVGTTYFLHVIKIRQLILRPSAWRQPSLGGVGANEWECRRDTQARNNKFWSFIRVPSVSLHRVVLLDGRLRLTRVWKLAPLPDERNGFFIENPSRRMTRSGTY
jgi:hypothetical protein